MKLVDILARVLTEWPEGMAFVGQASNGWLHMSKSGTSHDGYIKQEYEMADDWEFSEISRAQWQAAVDALKAEEGMPPIGSHVVVVDDGTLMYGQGESGEVLAHVDGTAVIRMSYGLGCFLPRCLRSKEQIEADERDAVLNHMVRSIKDHPHKYQGVSHLTQLKIQEDACIDLFAAGYRKFEIVDKDDGEGV